MKRPLGMCVSLIFALAPNAVAQEKPPLKLMATTPLPGFSGDFDHFALDLKGKPLHSITGFGQPHAAVFLPDVNKLIVTDGDDFGMVELVSGEDYKILDTIKLPPGVDGAVFNPVNQYYYVESGSDEPGAKTHALNIID